MKLDSQKMNEQVGCGKLMRDTRKHYTAQKTMRLHQTKEYIGPGD